MVARKQSNQLRRSVFSEISKAIDNLELRAYFTINKTDLTILCKVSCGAIVFVGVDDNSKLKSITAPQAGGVFDTLVMEEADAFSEEDFDQLRTRMRGISKHRKKTILIFNPVSKVKMRWQYERFFEPIGWDDEVSTCYEDETIFIRRYTYHENKFLGQDEKTAIESLRTRNPRFYRIFAEGKFGVSGKMVFEGNYRIEDFDIAYIRSLRDCEEVVGCDFGFIHKSAVVFASYNSKLNIIYIWGEIGVREKTKVELAKLIKAKIAQLGVYNALIRCDSAEPASIRELQQQGLRATQANKGPDSVRRGVDFIQSQEIIIHPSCPQIYDEFTSLTYKKDVQGYTEVIDDSTGDDLIASLRYAVSHITSNTGQFADVQVKY